MTGIPPWKEGWGLEAVKILVSDQENLFSRDWSVPESHLYINLLELRAIHITLQLLMLLVASWVMCVESDNTTMIVASSLVLSPGCSMRRLNAVATGF